MKTPSKGVLREQNAELENLVDTLRRKLRNLRRQLKAQLSELGRVSEIERSRDRYRRLAKKRNTEINALKKKLKKDRGDGQRGARQARSSGPEMAPNR